MKAIRATAIVDDGVLKLEVPVSFEPGRYRVEVIVEEASSLSAEPEDDWVSKLRPLDWSAWPKGSAFGRDELYDDDER